MDAAVSDEVLRAHRKEATAARPQRLEEARKEAEEEAEVLKKKFDQAALKAGGAASLRCSETRITLTLSGTLLRAAAATSGRAPRRVPSEPPSEPPSKAERAAERAAEQSPRTC